MEALFLSSSRSRTDPAIRKQTRQPNPFLSSHFHRNGFIDYLGNDWKQAVSETAIRTAIERVNEIPTQFSKDGKTTTTKYRPASICSLPRALVFFFTARNNRGYRMPYYRMPWSSLLAPFRAYDFAIRGVLIDDHRAAIRLELKVQNAALKGGDADFEFVLCTNSPLIQLRKNTSPSILRSACYMYFSHSLRRPSW